MEPEHDYQLLPTRETARSDGSFEKLQKVKFYTNFIEITTNLKKMKVYQYSLELNEEIPQDSTILYEKAVKSIIKQLRERIGYISSRGKIIWGSVHCDVPLQFTCNFESNKQNFSLIATVLETNELDNMETQENKSIYLQVLNSDLKNNIRNNLELKELGRQSKYFGKSSELKDCGLIVYEGYKLTITSLGRNLYLQIDPCSRVVQMQTVLEMIEGWKKKGWPTGRIEDELVGKVVQARFGKMRNYAIEGIQWKKSPEKQTFYYEKIGEQISIKAYYQKSYSLKIKAKEQPLLLGVAKGQKRFGSVLIPPELFSLTGLTDFQRGNFTFMQKLDPYTKLSSYERTERSYNFIQKQKENLEGNFKIENFAYMDGVMLKKPQIKFINNKVDSPDDKGTFNKGRNKLFQFQEIPQICLLNSVQEEEEQNAIKTIKKGGDTFGVKFGRINTQYVNGNAFDVWRQAIDRCLEKYKKTKFFIFLLNQREERFYGNLKRYLLNEKKMGSQVIKCKTLQSKRALSAGGKIAVQIATKTGSVPWKIEKTHKHFKNKNVMYGGLAISKGRNGYCLSFVGTINPEGTQIYSTERCDLKSKEDIPLNQFQQIFKQWARNYFRNNGVLKNKEAAPNVIIVYREGLAESQIQAQVETQIKGIQFMIEQMREKLGQKYSPEIVYLTANKKITTRFFKPKQGKIPPKGKLPEAENPKSGSVIIQGLSKNNAYDFHLVPQFVNQGTCTPTHFTVVYNVGKIPQQALISFTFDQCFGYYNWQGAIRVPACLQYADKLARLVSEHVEEEIYEDKKENSLQKSFFFL